MAQEERASLVVLDRDTSSSKRLIESSSNMTTRSFETLDGLLNASINERVAAIFVDTDFIPAPTLMDEIHRVREKWPTAPLIALTDQKIPENIAHILRSGFDEFFIKPLDSEQLNLRLQVKILQVGKEKERAITVGDLSVDPSTRSIKSLSSGKVKFLSPIEVNLLSILLSSMGQSISRDNVKRKCWGTTNVSDNALNRKLFEVRKALSQIGSEFTVKTLYGSGYAIQKKNPGEDI